MTKKSTKSASRVWSGPRPTPCGRRLMASVYPSRMLAFPLIPGHMGNVASDREGTPLK